MRHIWKKDETFEPHDGYFEKKTCERCGLIVMRFSELNRYYGKRFYHEYFERSGTLKGFGLLPKCLDWNDDSLD